MIRRIGLFFPWLLALIATVGSLYFSEAFHIEPCKLCWYQRTMIFPLAIILGIAAFRGAYRIVIYILPLSLIGLAIAVYQVLMVWYFSDSASCPACTVRPVAASGSAFPLLSLLGFLILNTALFWIYFRHKKSKKL